MHAPVMYDHTGGPEVFYLGQAPTLEPCAGEVQITVVAASANLFDAKLRSGSMPMPQTFPATPGIDASGVISEIGEGVDFAIGDAVFGTGRATYAEEAILTAYCAKPDAVDHEQAAAVATIGETAFRGLAHTSVAQNGTVVICKRCPGKLILMPHKKN